MGSPNHYNSGALAYHFHGDHLFLLLLKNAAGQWNTLVSFKSALARLDGQFSVGVNTLTMGCKVAPPN